MIRACTGADFDEILGIVNDGAQAYRGVIPDDCWHEPYMSRNQLRREIESGVVFSGVEQGGRLAGVMGIQDVLDVMLIRHAYVRTALRGGGIGSRLLTHLRGLASRPILIGTWADAGWAIAFYRKHGFELAGDDEKDRLLAKYWNIPARQAQVSVVLRESSVP